MSFDAESINRLRETTWIRTTVYRKVVGSTNDLALRRARDDALELPVLVLADRQTTGRGRGANRWWSPAGALAFSVLLATTDHACERGGGGAESYPVGAAVDRVTPGSAGGQASADSDHRPPPVPMFSPAPGLVSLATGLAVCEALQQLQPALPVGLKWPNDVLVSDRKIAGILVEKPPNRPDRIVLGIGINVNNSLRDAPDRLARQATSLIDEAHYSFPLMDVLTRVLWQLREQLCQLASDRSQLVRRWQTLCVLTDKQVQVNAGTHVRAGLCRGIDADGALILDTPEGRQHCGSGRVTRYA